MPIRFTQFLQQPSAKLKHQSEQGFTLVESLMGMVIISIVVVAMTPPILLTVGTRVQNRRAEQAMQLAQGEIDRVRVLVEQSKYKTDDVLPAAVDKDVLKIDNPIESVAAPKTPPDDIIKSENKSCTNLYAGAQIAVAKTLRVDIDRDCKKDFLVQTFRDNGIKVTLATGALVTVGFRMGVRVYAAVAEPNVANLETQPASLKVTTALGSQRSRPLAVAYTTIVRSDLSNSLNKYNDLLPP